MNANDKLKEYNSTENHYKFGGYLVITDGVKAMAEMFESFWLLDIIASYQSQLRNEDFQVWTLGKFEDSSAIVICTDGNNRVVKKQKIGWTDFGADEATIWVEGNVALLPSEH